MLKIFRQYFTYVALIDSSINQCEFDACYMTDNVNAGQMAAKEMLGLRLMVTHNLYFYNSMMEEIRDAIEKGCFKEYKKKKLEQLEEEAK